MTPRLKIRGPLEPRALRVVRELPQAAAEPGADAMLMVDGRKLDLEVTYRSRIGVAEAWQLTRVKEQHVQRRRFAFLVIADRTTEEARQVLADNGLAYIDGDGNAHFDLPGLYMHIERPRQATERQTPLAGIRLAGKAGVAAQALLLEPDRAWRVTDLAGRANISVGLAHAVLDRLQTLKIVEAEGDQRALVRRIVNPAALLDTWLEENRDRGVRRAGAFLLPERGGDASVAARHRLRQLEIDHALTGVAAAALLAPFLTTITTATFWIDESHPLGDVIRSLDADPTDLGANVVLMQANGNSPLAFSEDHAGLRLANIFRVYYDTRNDPQRGREQAEHLRELVIGRR